MNLVMSKENHDPKAWPCVLLGYQEQQAVGWRNYLPKPNEFIVTTHASFEDHRVRSSIGVDRRTIGLYRCTIEELRSVELDNTDVKGSKNEIEETDNHDEVHSNVAPVHVQGRPIGTKLEREHCGLTDLTSRVLRGPLVRSMGFVLV